MGLLALCAGKVWGQQALRLPEAQPVMQEAAQRFTFASDGPAGPGWTRPDAIARVYGNESLPVLFRRTLRLDQDVPRESKLSWIFTGPHAGLTVELTDTKVHLVERYYDSVALSGGSYPDKVVREQERQFVGHVRELTVVADAHLSVMVILNGEKVIEAPLVFDLTRQQLMFSGPRNEHMVLSGALLKERTGETTVSVEPGKTHQVMLGFGGSPSIPAYAELSDEGKKEYWAILRRYNLLIDREYPMGTQMKQDLSNVDDLHDATPHYYGDNFPNGEVSDFEYSRKTREMGGMVLYEMWALPSWAIEAYTNTGKPVIDAWGKVVKKAAKPDVYARTVVEFCRKAKERSGAAPEIVGIENEVEQPPQVFAAMTTALRKALDAAGFQTTKIQMADAPYMWIAVNRVKDLKGYPEAWKATDYTAAHQYDYQEFLANPDMYDERLQSMREESEGKPFLATEICLNDGAYQEPSYRVALQVGQLYQKDLTELDAEALMYCWLLLDVEQPTFGSSRSLLVPDRSQGEVPVASSFELRVLGAFSRHVLKGMKRVESESGDKDLLTAAFTDGTKSSLIVMNRSIEAKRLNVEWKGPKWTRMEKTSFYLENVESAAPEEVVVQSGEIVTLSNFSAEEQK
ncbi:hypothetical protein GCM10011585_30220 [Edaphobacter dinghuensis]|uniref:Uncharacterized protein n=2 Tax=Edaphobacter dinghuensis TaxID=1560005 RepID=A0A917HMJ7_9BACT|nr:hypothetical protein GCM10011585_30220 [Edaphobacter dinghuensis]